MPKRLPTLEEAIERANLVHDSKYDYSETSFKSTSDKVKIICQIHGEFYQRLSHHFSGRGCPSCGKESSQSKSREKTLSVETFIQESNAIHDGKYSYENVVEIKNARTKVAITCPVHGVFWQTPHNHRTCKHGCDECRLVNRSNKMKLTLDEFVSRAEAIHNGFYSYHNSIDFDGSYKPVTITCPIHGDFKISHAGGHLYYMNGCPSCGLMRSRSSDSYPDELMDLLDCWLYLVKISNPMTGKEFLKVGITRKNTVYERFYHARSKGFIVEVLDCGKYILRKCIRMENEILDRLDDNNMRFRIRDLKDEGVGGWSECFYEGDIDLGEWFY